jgi:hypothetical protein
MKTKKAKATLLFVIFIIIIGWYITATFLPNKDSSSPQQKMLPTGMDDRMFDKHIYIDAKLDEFNNLDDVEKKTDAIVIAEKISQDAPTILYGVEGRIDIAYTLSTFQVKKVISSEVLKSGDTFTMLENEAYDKKQDVTYHIAGYHRINQGQDYLLFLQQSDTDPYYIVTGVNYGKVNLEENETDYPKELRKADTEYSREILSKYAHQENIRADAKRKYAEFIDASTK